MPDTKVTVKIKGLAFCHMSQDKLEVLFLYTRKHALKLLIRKDGVIQDPVALPKRCNMSLDLTRTTATPGRGVDDDCSRIIDFNKHLHEAQIKLKENQQHLLSYLTIPRPYCYTIRESKYYHEFWKIEADGRRTRKDVGGEPKRKIGLEMGADFLIQPAGGLQINVAGAVNDSFPFPQADNITRYEITFDNSCSYQDCGNDFIDYYEILEERGKNVRFEEVPLEGPPFNDEAACNVTKGDPSCDLLRYYQTGTCP